MAATTAATLAAASAYFNYRESVKSMGLHEHHPDREELELYEQMCKHREKVEADLKKTIREGYIGTGLLIALIFSVIACILDWTGVF